jgi:hypothetical protein
VRGKFVSEIAKHLKEVSRSKKKKKGSKGNSKEAGNGLASFVRNQGVVNGKDLCHIRRKKEIQALRDKGLGHWQGPETMYWEGLEEAERVAFNEEAATMKTCVSEYSCLCFY